MQAKQKEEKILLEVLPQASHFEPVKSACKEIIYYRAYSKDNQLVGAAFKASGKGYSSTIETMAGMTMDGKISAIKILSQNETPGLGNRITEDSFLAQFSGKDIPGLARAQAITGATVSSRAVMDSVGQKMQEIKTLIEDEK